ncbi:hypothetical protein PUN28_019597 [Cardiocondyla obscurior]|uniref:Uncharacterized protein n=1 Tax=Cardiocondyla obscurior TaxID=286306 RepID=A0AAW2EBJ0_9HYME
MQLYRDADDQSNALVLSYPRPPRRRVGQAYLRAVEISLTQASRRRLPRSPKKKKKKKNTATEKAARGYTSRRSLRDTRPSI